MYLEESGGDAPYQGCKEGIMYELELFAGAGGGILGKNLLGFRTVGAVEIEPYCRRVLLQRQRDLCCPMFPIWDDVKTFRIDNEECRAYIEWLCTIRDKLTISGGFPCQDISASGKGRGITGRKSGLWFEMARIIGEIRPAFAFVENSPMLATRGLEGVLASLAEMGYDAKWCVLGAGHLGYPIKRDRLWILGKHQSHNGRLDDSGNRQGSSAARYLWSAETIAGMSDADPARLVADGLAGRTPDGVAHAVDRVRAAGNGQVPAVAALAWRILSNRF